MYGRARAATVALYVTHHTADAMFPAIMTCDFASVTRYWSDEESSRSYEQVRCRLPQMGPALPRGLNGRVCRCLGHSIRRAAVAWCSVAVRTWPARSEARPAGHCDR